MKSSTLLMLLLLCVVVVYAVSTSNGSTKEKTEPAIWELILGNVVVPLGFVAAGAGIFMALLSPNTNPTTGWRT
jgi:hypothetical protein